VEKNVIFVNLFNLIQNPDMIGFSENSSYLMQRDVSSATGIKKAAAEEESLRFVINRGLIKCWLYTV